MYVLYSLDVEGDLDAIAGYIAADNPRRAISFVREIMRRSNVSPTVRNFISYGPI